MSIGPRRTLLLLGAFAAASIVSAPTTVAAATCGPAPAGQVAVVVVVDRGAGTPSSRCVVVAEGSTGADALVAAGHTLRLRGAFVCAVDGYPATGCAEREGGGFDYWRYWHAAPGGTWSYSSVGAYGYRLPQRCAVEGWSWGNGGVAGTSNVPPRIAPQQVACDAAPVVTQPPATSPPVTAAPSTPSGGAATPVPAPSTAPARPGAVSGSGAAPSDAAGPAPGTADEAQASPGDDATPADPSSGGDATAPGDQPDGESATTVAGDAEVAGESMERAGVSERADERAAAVAASASTGSSSGSAVGALVAAGLIAVLVVVMALRRRQVAPDVSGFDNEGP